MFFNMIFMAAFLASCPFSFRERADPLDADLCLPNAAVYLLCNPCRKAFPTVSEEKR